MRPRLAQLPLILSAVAFCASAHAGTIILSSNNVATTFSNAAESGKTLTATQVGTTGVKITGDAVYTKSSAAAAEITATISGNVNVAAGETFFESHDFTFTLTGSGSVTWNLVGQVSLFGTFTTVVEEDSAAPLVGPSSQRYTGTDSGSVPLSITAPFRAILTVDWINGAANDTLTINIPNNSIDFAVPEPSAMAALCMSGVGLFARRRRAQ